MYPDLQQFIFIEHKQYFKMNLIQSNRLLKKNKTGIVFNSMIGFYLLKVVSQQFMFPPYLSTRSGILEGLRIIVQLDLLKLSVHETLARSWVSGFWTRK